MIDKINIGVGLSTEKDAAKAAKEAVLQARATIYKEKIDLAIVFSSVELAHPNTLKAIANLLGPVPIIGCSAAALISNKGVFRNGLGIMLLSFSKETYFIASFVKDVREKTALKAGEELGDKLFRGFQDTRRNVGVIFSDGLMEDGSNFLAGLMEKLGTSFPLVGASASDNLEFLKTFVYFNQEASSNAAGGILLGGKSNFGLGIKHGWKPLGKPRRVTKAKSNIVYEIDGAPASKTYEYYLARDLNSLKKELKRISLFYPIGIHLEGEKEYLLRNIHSIENDGSLVFHANVPEDSIIRLMIGTKESCLSATQQAAKEVIGGLAEKKISFALVFDSVSRYSLLGREAAKELEIIKTVLGNDTPIFGIYTYGEQAPLRSIDYHGKTYFHNQTITILGIAG